MNGLFRALRAWFRREPPIDVGKNKVPERAPRSSRPTRNRKASLIASVFEQLARDDLPPSRYWGPAVPLMDAFAPTHEGEKGYLKKAPEAPLSLVDVTVLLPPDDFRGSYQLTRYQEHGPANGTYTMGWLGSRKPVITSVSRVGTIYRAARFPNTGRGFNVQDFVSNHVKFLRGFHYQLERSWWVIVKGSSPIQLLIPTNSRGARALLKLRDVPDGKQRREALQHWVVDHWREVPETEEETYVRAHLQGRTRFRWFEFDVELRAPLTDRILNEDVYPEERRRMRLARPRTDRRRKQRQSVSDEASA